MTPRETDPLDVAEVIEASARNARTRLAPASPPAASSRLIPPHRPPPGGALGGARRGAGRVAAAMKPSPTTNGTGSASEGDAPDPYTSGAPANPVSVSTGLALRSAITANRSVLAHALFAVVAIVVVGWMVPLSDRAGYVMGAVLTALAIATIPWPEGRA